MVAGEKTSPVGYIWGMEKSETIIEKIWRSHAIHENDHGETLLFVDRHYLEEGCVFAFEDLRQANRPVRRPDLTFAVADHLVPTRGRPAGPSDPELADVLARMRRYTGEAGVEMYDQNDPGQGIIHVVAPELGLSLPGTVIACGDSHTSTHGALGALALSIGASECAHVLATQSLWQSAQPTLRLTVEGALPPGTVAKDLMLTIIARIGNAGASGHIVEYAGSAIRGLSMEGRMTLCNMSAEAGARAGLIAPDQTTFDMLRRARAPPKAMPGRRRWPIGGSCPRTRVLCCSTGKYGWMPAMSRRVSHGAPARKNPCPWMAIFPRLKKRRMPTSSSACKRRSTIWVSNPAWR